MWMLYTTNIVIMYVQKIAQSIENHQNYATYQFYLTQ